MRVVAGVLMVWLRPGQVYCYEDPKLLKLFADIIRILYDYDILGEDTIKHWHRKGSAPKVPPPPPPPPRKHTSFAFAVGLPAAIVCVVRFAYDAAVFAFLPTRIHDDRSATLRHVVQQSPFVLAFMNKFAKLRLLLYATLPFRECAGPSSVPA